MKRSLFSSIIRTTGLSLAIAAFAAGLSAQTVVSLNVYDGAIAGNSAVDAPFGIASLGTVAGNWNNSNSFGAASPMMNLIDSTGAATGVSATIVNSGGQQYWGADYAKTPWNFGPAHFVATANPVSVGFSNLTAAFPFGYYAVVYVNGAPANPGAAVTDGTTTYFFQTSNPANNTPILITDINSGDGYDVGNYAVFGSDVAPLFGDAITFTIPTGSVVANNVGIGGVQLVGVVPEPGTYAVLLGLVAVGAAVLRRRASARRAA